MMRASDGLGTLWGKLLSALLEMSCSRIAFDICGGCNSTRSWNDLAYQFLTLMMDGILLKLRGNSSSSLTR